MLIQKYDILAFLLDFFNFLNDFIAFYLNFSNNMTFVMFYPYGEKIQTVYFFCEIFTQSQRLPKRDTKNLTNCVNGYKRRSKGLFFSFGNFHPFGQKRAGKPLKCPTEMGLFLIENQG